MACIRRATGLLAALAIGAATVSAAIVSESMGPPLVCHEVEIGSAESLPWGKGAWESDKQYNKSKVVDDTMKLLKTQRDALVRMETIRRAVVYIDRDQDKGAALLLRVMNIALDQAAAGKQDAEAWFNAGFVAACFDQVGLDVGVNVGAKDGINGYRYITKAIEIQSDPSMHYAAALMTIPGMVGDGLKDEHEAHVRAAAAAESGSLVERNLSVQLKNWGRSLEEVRKASATAKK